MAGNHKTVIRRTIPPALVSPAGRATDANQSWHLGVYSFQRVIQIHPRGKFMLRTLALVLLLAASRVTWAQTSMPKPTYDFSLPRQDRIALAESAAPPEISAKATVYLLDPTGYVKIRDGSNGFSCFVDRQTPWNCEPTCFDAEGSATTLPTRFFAEEQRAKGKSEEQIKKAIDEGYKSGKFRVPGKPGIVYMLSDRAFLLRPDTNQTVPVPPHLMFYAPYATDQDIGSPPAAVNMPRVIRPGQPDAYIIVFPRAVEHQH